jgi:mannose/cellobiose epimerase-like protein (N-acyl-D-glucosamine 2-epimerase family)
MLDVFFNGMTERKVKYLKITRIVFIEMDNSRKKTNKGRDMKPLALIFALLLTLTLNAQTFQSKYLENPDNVYGYMDSTAGFWLSAWDATYGGFFTDVSRNGTPTGTTKWTITQSRNAYGMTRAFMLTGDTTYLDYARAALQFMYDHCWDNTNGGWYQRVSRTGTPISPGSNKSAFDQHYALLGIAAFYEATRDSLAWHWLQKGYNDLELHLWDSRPDYFGYYDYGSFNWGIRSGKSFNATVDAVTTHLLTLYLTTRDPRYLERMREVADNMLNRLIASMGSQAIGFAEGYNSNWQIDAGNTMTIMGHVLKTGWCLARLQQIDPHPDYLDGARTTVDHVLAMGYDHEYGGPYKDYNRITGQMLMWGIPDTAKAWWQMEQAITAGLQLYHLTGEGQYLQAADESLDFFMKYFVDHQYGEVYENRARDGSFISQWGSTKGGSGKAAYHSTETGYYTYLYGHLLVHVNPATLYYRFDPADSLRSFAMTPLAIADSALVIQSVALDGQPYNDFDAAQRVIYLPPGVGGMLAVTYAPAQPLGIAGAADVLPQSIELAQNYPNPFNPSTTIAYRLQKAADVQLAIYTSAGERVTVLVAGPQAAGSYRVQWNGRDSHGESVASGIYFYRLTAGKENAMRKMVLLK